MNRQRIDRPFYMQDVLIVAPALLGKYLVRRFPSGEECRRMITEVEAYRGIEDRACHASKGRSDRTEVMFRPGGEIYVYMIYGMYWMLNIVTGKKDAPQTVFIRGIEGITGPGRLTKALEIDKSFYGEDLSTSRRLWVEKENGEIAFTTTPRIGINYAGPEWASKPWRWVARIPLQ